MLNSNETIYRWHKIEIGMHRAAEPYSLNSFYPYGRQLMFTQPFETLDTKLIKYYEDKIKNGERPVAISIRVKRADQQDEESYQETGYNTTKYILDGHHKLVAYQNLNIKPTYIVINRINRGMQDEHDESSLPNLNMYLFYYQIEHIVNNGLESMKLTESLAKYIDEYLRNTPRIEDTLVRTLYRSAIENKYGKDQDKQNWFLGRLNVLIDKIDNLKSDLYLDYHCREDHRRKYIQVSNWQEVKEKL